MKKYFDIALKVIFSLILAMPILGVIGLLGEPTPELYSTPEAFEFIAILMNIASYIDYIMVVVCILTLVFMWTGRTPLSMLLILPITVNVVGFHLFLDGGLFTMGALVGNIMALINLYFLWQYRAAYRPLLERTA